MPELAAIGLPACGPNSWYEHRLTLPRTEQPFETASGCEHGSVQAKEAYPFLTLRQIHKKSGRSFFQGAETWLELRAFDFSWKLGFLTGKHSQSLSHRVDGGFCHHWKVVGEKLSSGFFSHEQLISNQLGGLVRCCGTEGRRPHPLPTEPRSMKKVHYLLGNPPPF